LCLNVSCTNALPCFTSPSEAMETMQAFKGALVHLIALSAVWIRPAWSSVVSFLQLPEMMNGFALYNWNYCSASQSCQRWFVQKSHMTLHQHICERIGSPHFMCKVHISALHVLEQQLHICDTIEVHAPPLGMLSTPPQHLVCLVTPPWAHLLCNLVNHQYSMISSFFC
jgi:hypothetical protein